MKGSGYVLTYALATGLVVSAVLTAVGQMTAPYRQANERAEQVKSILEVLEVPVPRGVAARELVALYEQTVAEQRRGELILYRFAAAGDASAQAFATRFEGPGLWGPIKGFLALEPDGHTIRGITFYQQEETPGLGGEIVSPKFRKRFVRKSIGEPDGTLGLRIVPPGTAKADNEVDAVTGATMTSSRVEAMLNECITKLLAHGQRLSGEGGHE